MLSSASVSFPWSGDWGRSVRVQVLVVAVAVAAALPACSGTAKSAGAGGAGKADGPKTVAVDEVRGVSMRRAVEVVGTLAAEAEVTISAEVEGRVSQLRADLGDRVRAGQVLIELDREKSEYSLTQQRANLSKALARYGAADPTHLPEIEQTPDVQKAQAELVQAKQAYERAQELHKRQLLPKQALDDADATRLAKQATYEASLQGARNLRADIEGTQAAMRLADRQLRDTSIRAPFDGFVQKRLVSLGEFVKNQTPVMAVVAVDPLKAIGEIPEKLAPWISVGQVVTLEVDAFPGERIAGKVARISPAVNPATRAFPFEALVPNASGRLKPGTFARVRIDGGKVDQVLMVPVAALQYRYGQNRVFIVEGDHLQARELTLGDRADGRVEVTGTLKPGEQVAVGDVERFGDGMKVTVKPAAAAAAR